MESHIIETLKNIRHQCLDNELSFGDLLGESWQQWNIETIDKLLLETLENE
jgi:hypothetical protein